MLTITQLKIQVAIYVVVISLGVDWGVVLQETRGEEPNGKKIKSTEAEVRKQLIGEWKAISLTNGGRVVPDEILKTAQMTITENHLILTGGDRPKRKFKYTVEFKEKPYWFNLIDEDNDTLPGIIEVIGDDLKICFNETPDGERSNKFVSEGGTSPNDTFLVAKRIKQTD